MTSSESQPRTRAGKALLKALQAQSGSQNYAVEWVTKIEAEAAQDSRPLDVERLARLYMRVRGAHGPNGEVEDHGQPCAWCILAAAQHIEVIRLAEYARLAAEEPHD